MIETKQMKQVVEDNFYRYAGNVILDRAICDVRDMLKPSARMLIYSQKAITKNTHNKPTIKSATVVGDCLGHLYEHGDDPCYQNYVRMSQPFSMRIPLEDFQGNRGTMIHGTDFAAMRYTQLRLNEISSYLYGGLEKNAIGNEWKNNFDETEKYPGVMPSIGYFNICNGTIGLGIAISSSIPQFNLREVNEAIIKLIQNPDVDDKEIIIMPDFATGGILLNRNEVYESLIAGKGKACKLRAVLEYNPDTNSIWVKEMPYSVFTNTISEQIAKLTDEDPNYGIEKVNDDSGLIPEVEIVLKKGVNPKKMIDKLYKDTSLENHFTINMWVLENGRFPKVMGLREIFTSYITHIRTCKRREVQFDLDKALARKNIVDGLIRAYSIIDEVVTTIRASSSPSEAAIQLINKFQFNEEQAKAILAMRLSSLTKLDIVKLNNELEQLIKEIEWCQYLLNNSIALDAELIKILHEVAEHFGDARRTKILNIVENENEVEQVNEEDISIMLFDNNMFRLVKKEDLQGGKKGKKGTNIKPPKNANLINTLYTTNLGSIAAFTNDGKMYSFTLANLDYNKDYSVYEVINLQNTEKVILLIDTTSFNSYHNLVTVSKNGYIKKTAISEYGGRTKKGVAAVKLEDKDTLIGVYLSMSDEDKIFITSTSGNYNFYKLNEVQCTARATKGVKAIKLLSTERIQSATLVKQDINYLGILTINSAGNGKITPINEFNITSRAIKGGQVMSLKSEKIASIYAVPEQQKYIYVSANNKAVLLDIKSIPIQARTTTGIRLIDIRGNNASIEIM